jgi:hypothetical protein
MRLQIPVYRCLGQVVPRIEMGLGRLWFVSSSPTSGGNPIDNLREALRVAVIRYRGRHKMNRLYGATQLRVMQDGF